MSGPKIILHIGTYKTGTTSLQHFLSRNRTLFLGQGLLYPSTGLHWEAHHNLARALYLCEPMVGDWTPQAYLQAFETELAASAAPLALVSSERFGALHPNRVVEYLGERLDRVVVYLRRQDEWYETWYRECLKNSHTTDNPAEFLIQSLAPNTAWELGHLDFKPDHARLIQAWQSVLRAPEKLVVRFYEEEQIEGDIVLDFFKALGIEAPADAQPVDHLNRRFSSSVLAFRRSINRRLTKVARDALIDPIWWANMHVSSQDRSFFTPALRQFILDYFAVSNATAARLLARPGDTFFVAPQPSRDDLPSEAADSDFLAAVFSALISHQQQLIEALGKRVRALER